MKNFRDLKVWQKGHELAIAVYKVTKTFPPDELYGLTSQMRRASVSIPTNIAEGCGRGGNAEFGRFLQVAMGSASELEYHVLLSHELGLLSDSGHTQLIERVTELKRMLAGLIGKVRADR